MICIYRTMDFRNGHRLSVMAKWRETNASNLRVALLAIEHAPLAGISKRKLMIEIDGVTVDLNLLPKSGPNLEMRCGHWLEFRWGETRLSVPRPVFGL